MKKTSIGPGGIRLELDRSQVYPDDPGQGTPAMVYSASGLNSSTFWCAMAEGTLDSDRGFTFLSEQQIDWLNEQEQTVDDFLYNIPYTP